MKIKAEDPEGVMYKVIDLHTNQTLDHVTWADDETGEYEIILKDDNGDILVENGIVQTELRKGNIKLEKMEEHEL